jgi:hypothetical protein
MTDLANRPILMITERKFRSLHDWLIGVSNLAEGRTQNLFRENAPEPSGCARGERDDLRIVGQSERTRI